jgi:membrane associated rhomboid family serine protease
VKTEDPLGGLPGPPAPEQHTEPERFAQGPRRIPPTPTTVLLLAVLGAGFAAQVALGGADFDRLAAFRLGSLTPAAIADGDWYRLGSYAFLHGGAVHLLVNAWALWALMRPIEASLGPFAALGIFSGAAIAGGGASFGWSMLRGGLLVPAVGASGGIFGLFGAHCAIYLRVRKYLPVEIRRQAARPLIANLFISGAMTLGAIAGGLPLDNAAHAGGFVSGMAFGALAAVPTMLPPRPWNRFGTVLFWLCAAALASMEGAAVARAAHPSPRILQGEGVAAAVPWQILEIEHGIGVSADVEFEVQIDRLEKPPASDADAQPVRIGTVQWRKRRAVDGKGIEYVDLVQPDSQLLVRVACLRTPCAEDKRDALAEEVASHARTTGPP